MEKEMEMEYNLLATAPLAAKWIVSHRQFTEKEVEEYSKLYPVQFEYTARMKIDDIVGLLSRHRNSMVYGKQIEVVLSPDGMRWLEETLPIIKRVASKASETKVPG
jgi:hypothetical protein